MNEDIITAASKAGFETKRDMIWVDIWEITRFAALVRADEREACAKVAEEFYYQGPASSDIADAIRARSQA